MSTRLPLTALAAAAVLGLSACGGGFEEEPVQQQTGPATIQVLIAGSGDAETTAVREAAQEWATETGNTVEVVQAQDMDQQLAQGFAGGNPPDVFYLDAARFADQAEAGNLLPYADRITDNADFYPNLRETFTYEGTQYCVPKDFSTLALVIRDDAWQAAGLTDADVPTTWEQLATVAQRLTTDQQAGLVVGDTRDRVGAFMVQAGGWFVNEDSTRATAASPENVEALTYVQGLLRSGVARYPAQVDSGWGGEALGTGRAAMVVEGNWIRGAIENDYPDVQYTVAELPAGPAGPGTLLFTQCWGIAQGTDVEAQAVDLVDHLVTPEQQLAFVDVFGAMPSRQSANEQFVAQFPQDAPFVAGAEYGQGPVTAPGMTSVLSDFDAGLLGLAEGDPQQILEQVQSNTQAVLAG